jgi:hypothetical protein
MRASILGSNLRRCNAKKEKNLLGYVMDDFVQDIYTSTRYLENHLDR